MGRGAPLVELSAFETFPHFLITFRRPDPRIPNALGFVIATGHVKRQAVIENNPVAIFGFQKVIGFFVGGFQAVLGNLGENNISRCASLQKRMKRTLVMRLFSKIALVSD